MVARIPAPVFGLQFLGRCPRLVWCRAVGAESIGVSSLCAFASVCISAAGSHSHTVTRSHSHAFLAGGAWRQMAAGFSRRDLRDTRDLREAGHKGDMTV